MGGRTISNKDQRQFKLKNVIIFLSLVLIGSVILSGAVTAANIVVKPGANAIHDAVNTANDGDTLNLEAGTYQEHDILIHKNLTINGPNVSGGNLPTAEIDAQKLGRVFKISPNTKLTLQNLIIENGLVGETEFGGGIYNVGNLYVTNCTIQKNRAGYGGGIYSDNGSVVLTNSQITNNTALDTGVYGDEYYGKGGGILSESGNQMTIINSKIYYNGNGGIYTFGNLFMLNSSIYSNLNSNHEGGGITSYGNTTLKNVKIYYNYANYDSGSGGGGIKNSGKMFLINTTVYRNSVYTGEAIGGGGITNWGSLTLLRSTVFKNYSVFGGGIANYKNLILINSIIYGNHADYNGGGIWNIGEVNLTSSRVFNNKAPVGGGLLNSGIMKISYCIISNNTAYFLEHSNIPDNGFGGGICNWGKLKVYCSNLIINRAVNGGGIFTIPGTICTLKYCKITGNIAYLGKAIYNKLGSVNATYNWWGSNSGPIRRVLYGKVTVKPWLTVPKIAYTIPTNLKTGVSRTSVLTIKFNENIKSSTYYNNIRVKNVGTGKYLTITKAISGSKLYIKTSIRSKNSWYQVIVPKAAVQSYAGNNFAAVYAFKFKTGT